MKRIFFAGLVLLLSSGAACATLCPKCRQMVHTADVGKCVVCDGPTASGAFKLCKTCSEKLGECECCRAKLDAKAEEEKEEKKPEPVDVGKSAIYTFGRWKYDYGILLAGEPLEKRRGTLYYGGEPIAQPDLFGRMNTPWGVMQFHDPSKGSLNAGWLLRKTGDNPIDDKKGKFIANPEEAPLLKIIQDNLDKFTMSLLYSGEQGKPFYRLILTTSDVRKDIGDTFFLFVNIDKDQAQKVVDRLLESGFLWRARAVSPMRRTKFDSPKAPGYRLTLTVGDWTFYGDLGWDLQMLDRLDDLREVLDGDAAKKMDLLIGRLNGYRRMWEAEKRKAAEKSRDKGRGKNGGTTTDQPQMNAD